jgi:subtilisin family serine protease
MPGAKMAAPLATLLDRALPGQPFSVIIQFRAAARLRQALVADLAVSYTYSLLPAMALLASADRIARLAQDPDIERIWLDLPVHTWLDTSVPLLGVPKAWATGLRGKGMTIAVVDTGADVTHPDLAGRVIATMDFTGQGFSDGHGHGTHVCGIAAGSGAASGGKYTGVAPEASLMVAKVLKADGAGFTSDVMAGLEWAVDQRAHVINLSLGSSGPADGTDALSAACDAAWGRGVVVCVAAGNDGPGSGTVGSPGSAHKVITVGATDDVDAIAGFSSRGPTQDGRQKPDICCPGVGIAAPRAAGTAMGSAVDDRYTRASGTSMATPHASGAAALILQANPAFTPDQVKGRLMETAKNLGLDGNTQGAGRASVATALGLDGNGDTPAPKPGCVPAVVSAVKGLMARR